MEDFLQFRRMVTPMIITVIFWIGIIATVLGGLISMLTGEFLAGLFMVLLGPLFVRIWCELLIVIFRINETLSDIRNNTAGPGA